MDPFTAIALTIAGVALASTAGRFGRRLWRQYKRPQRSAERFRAEVLRDGLTARLGLYALEPGRGPGEVPATPWAEGLFYGSVEGAEVRAWCPLPEGQAPAVWSFRVAISPPLPPGTQIQRRDAARGDQRPVKLGDPILDAQLAVLCPRPEAIRARLSDPALRGPLLEVLHQWPGSRLTPGEVILERPVPRAPIAQEPPLASLEASIVQAVRLAQLLSAGG